MDVQNIFKETNFETVSTVSAIAPQVFKCFSTFESDSKMADPGVTFSADCIRRDQMPSKRLIFAGKSPTFWVIAYEQGGEALMRMISVIRQEKNHAEVVWHGYLSSLTPLENIEDLQKLVFSNKAHEIKR